ncbi:hypothetical protein RN001_001277 [Aquatica leii]|uniref:RZZ complex subunit KNTC1/ROD C-terminal domain-containing protein n=1 Tax=Aquatica leii TaxID=1421715 RepID=A0AAN7PNC7_9COLE|nr:hypothetical protein RN001_001277 [Aquatica leii]
MGDWEQIHCGFNALDETINFGARYLGELDNLFEVTTLATIKNGNSYSDKSPIIHSVIINGSIYFSINKTFRIFKNLNCSDLTFSAFFEDDIDTFLAVMDGTIVLICFRTGNVGLLMIGETQELLCDKTISLNEDTTSKFFINVFCELEPTGFVFYLVSRNGMVYRLTAPLDICSSANDEELRVELLVNLEIELESAILQFPRLLCITSEYTIMYNVENKEIVSKQLGYYRKIYQYTTKTYVGLNNEGELIKICAITNLLSRININILFEDILLIADKTKDYFLTITKKNESGIKYIQLLSYGDEECNIIFSIKISEIIHFIIPEHIHDEIVYIAEIGHEKSITELRFQTVSETVPENRLQRLLRRQKFDEAEQFAKLFNLDLVEIQKTKAQLIVDKSDCTETDVTNLLNILDTLEDNSFKFISCLETHTFCTSLKDVERILKYMKSLPVSSATENLQGIAHELLYRFDTFMMLVRSNSSRYTIQEWSNFCSCNLLSELDTLLQQKEIEEWKIIYSRLDYISLEELCEDNVITTLGIISKIALKDQMSFLNTFIPLTLKVLPTAVNVFIDWMISKVDDFEALDFKNFPENALIFFKKLMKLLNIETFNRLSFHQHTVIDMDFLNDVKILLNTLEKVKLLKDDHGVVLPFKQMLQDILKYDEEYWIRIVLLMLNYIKALTKKLETIIIVIKAAKLPWCSAIRNIALESLKYSHPLVQAISYEIEEESKSVVLRKEPYNINWKVENKLDSLRFALDRIIFCNQPTMMEDIYQICKDPKERELADLALIRHFIKIGDFSNAFKILDNYSIDAIVTCCKKLIQTVTIAVIRQEWDVLENYFRLFESMLTKFELPFNFIHEFYRDIISDIRCLYFKKKTFNVTVKLCDFYKQPKPVIFQKVIPSIIEEYTNKQDIMDCIKKCEAVAYHLRFENYLALLELCREIGEFNFILKAASVFESINDSNVLCKMAILIISHIGSPETNLRVSDIQSLCCYGTIDIEPFISGLELARNIVTKAIINSTLFNIIDCLELGNWMGITYFLVQPKIDHIFFEGIYEVEPILPDISVFNAIKSIFSFYTSQSNNYLVTTTCSIDQANAEIRYLQSTITSLTSEGNAFIAYKLIGTLYNSLSFQSNSKDVHQSLIRMLKNSAEHLIKHIFSSSIIDVNLTVHLLIICNNLTNTKRLLFYNLKRYKRNLYKLEKTAEISLNYLKCNNIKEGQTLCNNLLILAKWRKKLKQCHLSHEEFFRQSPNEIILQLIKFNDINVKTIYEFCLDINKNVQEYYNLYLENLLLNWKPKYTITTNNYGREHIIVNHNHEYYLQECMEIIELLENKELVFCLLNSVWKRINFYHYEVFMCVLGLLLLLNKNNYNKENKMLLTFLSNYNRVSKPGDAEKEQWFTLYPDTQCIDPLSKWRLPFTPTLMSKEIWSIIRPEINLNTYKEWFEAISVLKYLTINDICSYVIKDIMSSGVLQSEKIDHWSIHPRHKDLLYEIDMCVANITNFEQATSALYSLIPNIPEGADLVITAELCYKYALKYQEQNPNSIDVEKAVIKVQKKYIHFSVIHILHANQLAEKKYLNMVSGSVDDLIESLYMDNRILHSIEKVDLHCPDINKAVDQLSMLYGIDIQEKKKELLNSWLSMDAIGNTSSLSLSHISTYCHSASTEYLIRSAYICKSGDVDYWQNYLLTLSTNKEKETKNVGLRAMALKCLCNISTVKTIESLTELRYEDFINFINKLSLTNELENFGFCLTVEMLDKQNKHELLNRLSYHMSNKVAVKLMASTCITYRMYDAKYWRIITMTMIKLKMFQELKESITFLNKHIVLYNLQWYIDAWQHVISNGFIFSININDSDLRKLYIENFFLIQSCPVLFSINLEVVPKTCLQMKQYDLVILSLQYLTKELQQLYLKELIKCDVCMDDNISQLEGLGFWGIAYIKEVVTEFKNRENI